MMLGVDEKGMGAGAAAGSTSMGVSDSGTGALRPGIPPVLAEGTPAPPDPNNENTPELWSLAHRSFMSAAGAASGAAAGAASGAAAASSRVGAVSCGLGRGWVGVEVIGRGEALGGPA